MTNYKLYFKILRKFIPQTFIYVLFFILLTCSQIKSNNSDSVLKTSSTIYWINEEENQVTEGLKAYIQENGVAEIVDISSHVQDEDFINDIILLNRKCCIMKIPKGFTESLYSKEPMSVEVDIRVENETIRRLTQLVNEYIQKVISNENEKELNNPSKQIGDIRQDAQNLSETQAKVMVEKSQDRNRLRLYFNEFIYGLSAVILVGIMSVNYSINSGYLKERRCCAPQQNKERWFLLKGHLLYGTSYLIFFILLSLFFGKGELFTIQGLIWSLNAVLLMVTLVEIGYLCSLFVKDAHVQMMVTNVFTLGCDFICGTQVEQEALSDVATQIAQFWPTYWYIKANNLVGETEYMTKEIGHQILSVMGIEILFILVFAVIGLVAHQQIEQGERGEFE
ncbi:MAG: ABC transporter permease [Cellulosilyticum sp.]|nr:ABC transporter permease [Cellulosilyticum sp.]